MSQLNSKQLKAPVNITGSLYGSASYALTASYAMNGGGGGGSTNPGGANTQIQYNNNGTFDGVPTLTYSGSTLQASGSFSGSFKGLIDSASYSTNSTLFNGKSDSEFATTGSNIFTGGQTISGSITFENGSTIQNLPGNFIVLAPGVNGTVELDSNDQKNALWVDNSGVHIATSGSTYNQWDFDTSGNLTAPGAISASSFTGSLEGTASFAISSSQAESSSYAKYAPSYLPLTGGTMEPYANITAAGGTFMIQDLTLAYGTDKGTIQNDGEKPIRILPNPSFETTRFLGNGNLMLQSDAPYTDMGYRLQVSGSGGSGAMYVVGKTVLSGSLIQGQEGNSASGDYSHAEGDFTQAKGDYSHAEGNRTIASGSHSHTEGYSTIASGDYSHAEGKDTQAIGNYSHAEGDSTIARGLASHAEGLLTTALGLNSHVEGLGTIASANYQHVQGQWNVTSSVESAFIIGNGTDGNNRSNLIYAAGNEVQITGSLKVTAGMTGSLFGTSSWSTNSVTASYYRETDPVFVAKSASLATTGSNIFIGNQTVTGSLFTTGSNTLIGSTTLTGSFNVTGSTTQIGNNNLLGSTTLSGSIIISGSTTSPVTPTIRVYGDMQTDGVIKFMPVSKNIDTSISASYIYVSGSTQDLYFSQNGSGYNNVTRLRWLEGNLYTGLLSGGVISASLGTNTYYVSSGSGVIVNLNAATASHDPYPTIQYLRWDSLSKTIDALSASFDQQFVAIDNTNAIYAQGTPYTDGDYNTKIPIGVVVHQNHSTINAFQTFPSVAYGWKQRSNDFIKAFGPLKTSGYVLAPSGSSTGSLVVGGGIAWVDGRNYTIDPNNPSYIDEAVGLTVSKIYRYYQRATLNDWIYDTNGGVGFATIDPTQYSNGTALVPLSNPNKWSIQRVFYFPNSATKAFYIYYGNAEYDSEAAALAAVNTESFTEAPNTAASAIYLGYMLLKKTADFTSATSFKIYQGGLYRGSGTGGGGGGGSTTPGGDPNTIQYNNAGAFGGITNFKWNGTSLEYTGSFITTGSLIVTGSATFTDSILIDSTLVTSSLVTTGAGNTTISTQATGSYRSMFAKYTVSNSTNARAGEFMAVWNAGNIQFTDTSTTDIGDTSALTLTGSLTATSVQLSTGVTAGWTIKTQTTYI